MQQYFVAEQPQPEEVGGTRIILQVRTAYGYDPKTIHGEAYMRFLHPDIICLLSGGNDPDRHFTDPSKPH